MKKNHLCAISLMLVLLGSRTAVAVDQLPNFDKFWDWDHPAQTRDKFKAILPEAEATGDSEYLNELLTQIARTYGLEGKFDKANAVLDRIEKQLPKEPDVATVRYLLERGRAFNSNDKPGKARPLFEKAFHLARQLKADYYAIDAAHMVAIAAKPLADQVKWTEVGLKLANESTDKRAAGWRGPLANNLGWDYFDAGDYKKALPIFQQAYDAFKASGNDIAIDRARWTVARCQRALGRNDEALATQLALLKKFEQTGSQDGYVYEELGELYLVRGEKDKAAGYFGKAYKMLSSDKWLMSHEPNRMARMKKLGHVGQ